MFHYAILYVGLAQALFASFVIATHRKVTLPDRILIACLLTIAVRFFAKIFNLEFPGLFNVNFSVPLIPLTFGPFMYLYTYYYIRNGEARFRSVDYLHFVPIFLFLVVYLVVYKDNFTFNEVTYFEKNEFFGARIVFGLLFFSSILLYSIFTFLMIRQYKRDLMTQKEYEKKRYQLVWLNFLSFFFVAIFIMYLVIGGINALSFASKFNLEEISNVGLTVLAYAVSYFGMTRSVMRDRISDYIVKSNHTGRTTTDNSIKFSRSESEALADRLEKYMMEEKPYLNPDLTLAELASSIGITKYDLTNLLNRHIEKNFSSYVNEFRMKEVLHLLEQSDKQHLTIISIAFDSGFNSKSTFNSLFKQYTGVTPSQYKRQVQQEMRPN